MVGMTPTPDLCLILSRRHRGRHYGYAMQAIEEEFRPADTLATLSDAMLVADLIRYSRVGLAQGIVPPPIQVEIRTLDQGLDVPFGNPADGMTYQMFPRHSGPHQRRKGHEDAPI
jgi:hypothetical protein